MEIKRELEGLNEKSFLINQDYIYIVESGRINLERNKQKKKLLKA